MAGPRASRGRQRLTHAIRRQSGEYRSPATLRTNAEQHNAAALYYSISHCCHCYYYDSLPLSIVGRRCGGAFSRLAFSLGIGSATHARSVAENECFPRGNFVVCVIRRAVRAQWSAGRSGLSDSQPEPCRQSADCAIHSYTSTCICRCTALVTIVM